ncbi:MAG: biotin--[acetyl-CoA-carboxylase] ligase [Pseudomonadota bacterium]
MVVFDSIDSTNEEARRRVEAGDSGPLWIASKQQTKGRGRQGRNWQSQPGNLAATGLFPFAGTPAEAAKLSFATSLAAAEVFEALAPRAKIALKWPNDALLNGKKAAGILLENLGTGADGSLRLAIGIGLNLIHAPPAEETKWPATSIQAESGSKPDFDMALLTLAARLDHWMTTMRTGGFAAIRTAWLSRAINLGRQIEVRLPTETLNGGFKGLDDNGALVLEMPGEVRHISAGDVYFAEGV